MEGTHFHFLGGKNSTLLDDEQKFQMKQVPYNTFLFQNLTSLHLLGTEEIIIQMSVSSHFWPAKGGERFNANRRKENDSHNLWLISTIGTGRICPGVDPKGARPGKWNLKFLIRLLFFSHYSD